MCKNINNNYEALKESWGYHKSKKYHFEIEVIEGAESTCHKVGDKFDYPKDRGIMCPWLLDSMSGLIKIMEFGGELPWTYKGTPYEKITDSEGISTEFVRCPDPSEAGITVRITRTFTPSGSPC